MRVNEKAICIWPAMRDRIGHGLDACPGLPQVVSVEIDEAGNATHAQATRLIARTTIEEPAG